MYAPKLKTLDLTFSGSCTDNWILTNCPETVLSSYPTLAVPYRNHSVITKPDIELNEAYQRKGAMSRFEIVLDRSSVAELGRIRNHPRCTHIKYLENEEYIKESTNNEGDPDTTEEDHEVLKYATSISREIDVLIREETLEPWYPDEEWVTLGDDEEEGILSEQYDVPDRPRRTVKEDKDPTIAPCA